MRIAPYLALALTLLMLTGPSAAATTFTYPLVGGDSTAVLEVPANVNVIRQEATRKQPEYLILTDAGKTCELRLYIFKVQQAPSQASLAEALAKSGQSYLAHSVETTIEVKSLENPAMTMCYYQLTDKAEDPRDGRYLLKGMAVDGSPYLFAFTAISKDPNPEGLTQILATLATLKIVPATAPADVPDAAAER